VFRSLKHILIILAVIVGISVVDAQSIEPKHTFNIELGLPNGFSNPAFKSIMQGLVSLAPYYQFDFSKHLTLGGGVRYSYFAVNEFKVPSPVYGGVHSVGGFVKLGWQKFHSDRFATDVGLKLGYMQQYFVTDRNDSIGVNPLNVNCFYLEPCLGLILTADEQNSYRFFASYGWSDFGFKPSMIGLETLGGYDPSDFNKITGVLIIGFGYTYYFKKD
jgi:hypothetical protein